MGEAAGHLLGEHDFSAYRALACQARSPVRHIHRLEVARHGELVGIDVVANGFLHHMVRNIAGVLLAIGAGRHPPRWALEVLQGRDRRLAGVTAPPDGLYLVGVEYPAHFGLPRVPPPPLLW
jgi:tRNA pseudouridine38-40 synthase